jgi:hypothetical protein
MLAIKVSARSSGDIAGVVGTRVDDAGVVETTEQESPQEVARTARKRLVTRNRKDRDGLMEEFVVRDKAEGRASICGGSLVSEFSVSSVMNRREFCHS